VRGASALQKVLDDHASAPLRVLVVWEPVIATDVGPPISRVLRLIHDTRAIQYWDAKRVLSTDIVRSVRADPSRYSPPQEIPGDFILWDTAILFSKGARWDENLPVPAYYGGPVADVIAEASQKLAQELSR